MTLLRIDEEAWARGFGREPFLFEHSLDQEPLLLPQAVAVLAGSLPAAGVEHHVSDVDAVTLDGQAPRVPLEAGEIAARIEELRCWMMLRNIERADGYQPLVDSCMSELKRLLDGRDGGMVRPEAYLFYSAAGSTTPAHLDSEHNFLCHVRGPKEVVVGRFPDEHTAQLKAERKFRGGHRNLDELPYEPRSFVLSPGQGIYIPPLTPHWVHTGDELCVSVAVTFRTVVGMRNELVHSFNGVVRRMGLRPRPPGRSGSADALKAALLTTWRRRPWAGSGGGGTRHE